MTTAIDLKLGMKVARGAKLLDKKEPGWASRISLDRLAMDSCHDCVLGQLHGRFFRGTEILSIEFDSARLGFTVGQNVQQHSSCDFVAAAFAELADLWRAEIRARTGSGVAP